MRILTQCDDSILSISGSGPDKQRFLRARDLYNLWPFEQHKTLKMRPFAFAEGQAQLTTYAATVEI
jgi:hypothetical protein